MLKALLKKEFNRLLVSFSINKRKKPGKKPGKGGIAGTIILWVFIFFSLGMAFAGMCHMLGDTLLPLGMDWLYYALMFIVAFVLNIFLNGFMSSAVLFNAKDNNLLLSLPIPPAYILFSRMAELVSTALLYTVIVTIPAFVVRCIIMSEFSVSQFIGCLVTTILIAFAGTAISAVLGWVIATIGKRIKNKSVFTVAFWLVFFGIYYYFSFNSQKYLAKLAEHSLGIGESIRKSVFGEPVYRAGMAMAGDTASLVYCLLITAVIFAAVYYVLSKKFIKIATTSEKTVDVKYNAEDTKNTAASAPRAAFFKKELARFLSSPVYMLNCGLGLVIFLAGAVVMVIKGGFLFGQISMVSELLADSRLLKNLMPNLLPVAGVLIAMLAVSMCDIAAPSISLEGKNLWILQSTPADPMEIFYAKQNLQLYLTAPVLALFLATFAYAFRIDLSLAIIIIVSSLMYVKLHAAVSLMLNLKMPNLDWTSEAVPIKQSLPITIAIFGSWLAALAVGALYFFVLQFYLGAMEYCVALLVLFTLGTRFANRWLSTEGVKIFAAL